MTIISVLLLWTHSFCECGLFTFEQKNNASDVILHVKVVDILDDEDDEFKNSIHYMADSNYTDNGGYAPLLRIIETFKGDIDEKVYAYPVAWSNCEVYFERNKSYYFFGYYDDEGLLKTNICLGTTIANDDLLAKIREAN